MNSPALAGEPRILVVEDDPDQALAFELRLQADGYSVVVALDSVSAMQKALRVKPDLVLLDLGLPGGGGLSLIDRMRRTPGLSLIPIVVVTARGVDAQQVAFKKGARAYLQKPVDPTELQETITNLLSSADDPEPSTT